MAKDQKVSSSSVTKKENGNCERQLIDWIKKRVEGTIQSNDIDREETFTYQCDQIWQKFAILANL